MSERRPLLVDIEQPKLIHEQQHHQNPNQTHVVEVHHDDRDWKEKVPGLQRPNFQMHPVGVLYAKPPSHGGPFVWSPGEKKIHTMDRNLGTAVLATIGSLSNFGRHNVPAGHFGISEDNGKLVLLGPGNHWMISPNHKYIGNISVGQPLEGNPIVNIRDQVTIVYVKEGDIAVIKLKGQYLRLLEGVHVIEGQNATYEGSYKLSESVIELGNVQIVTVLAGFIGFAYDGQGNLLKLDAGKHVLQKPDRTFSPYGNNIPFASLGERLVRKRPYLRIRVEGNEVCVISDERGEFKLLSCGVHEYFDPNVTLKDYLPLCQRTLAISKKKFKTSDNADVKTSFDVYFDICEPALTIKSLCDPEKCKERGDLLTRISEWVQEKAIDAMAAVIVHYQSTDIAVIPDVKSIKKETNTGADDRIQEIRKEFLIRLSQSLESVGIKLDSINLSTGLQIISEEAKLRVEGLIGAGAQEQLMMAEQRASLVRTDTEKQIAEIRAQIDQDVAAINAETNQKIKISNAMAAQKAAHIEAVTEALQLKTKLNVLIDCLGMDKAFEFLQFEQHVAMNKAAFGNAKTIVTANQVGPNSSLIPPLLMETNNNNNNNQVNDNNNFDVGI